MALEDTSELLLSDFPLRKVGRREEFHPASLQPAVESNLFPFRNSGLAAWPSAEQKVAIPSLQRPQALSPQVTTMVPSLGQDKRVSERIRVLNALDAKGRVGLPTATGSNLEGPSKGWRNGDVSCGALNGCSWRPWLASW